ncbi:MAG: hypothetical protein WED09_05390 [Homoserinimonas sp.]
MRKPSGLESKLQKFVTEVATGMVKDPKDQAELDAARLQVSEQIRHHVPTLQQEVVDRLRAHYKWAEIGQFVDLTENGATQRWQVDKAPSAPKDDLPGVSVDEAARQVGSSGPTVRKRVAENPDAEWHAQVPVEGKQETRLRILDMQALARIVRPTKKH